MTMIKKLFAVLLVLIILIVSQNQSDTKHAYSEAQNSDQLNLITMNEMSEMIGGCGGICKDYSHTCDSLCTHHNADKCKGTTGNCVNDGLVLLCDCPSYYEFTFGCD